MSNWLSKVIDYSGAGLIYNPYKEESIFNGGLLSNVSGLGNLFGGDETESTSTQTNNMYELLKKYYGELAPQLSSTIQGNLNASALPESVANALRTYYGQAGEKAGNYLSSKNMLNSGVADKMYSDLNTEEANAKVNALYNQQNTGVSQAMQFMGLGGTGGGTTTTTGTNNPALDWVSLGSMFAKLFGGGGGPTAAALTTIV
jgi:hypothetical protein